MRGEQQRAIDAVVGNDVFVEQRSFFDGVVAGEVRTQGHLPQCGAASYGPVQVRVRVRGTRLLAVTPLVYPSSGGRDREISSFALPQLEQEAITEQSAQIDTVSGATFTSDGYRRSLQSALDAAHFQAG